MVAFFSLVFDQLVGSTEQGSLLIAEGEEFLTDAWDFGSFTWGECEKSFCRASIGQYSFK
jgi:hypothetical protein